jgi:hypothetical protein
MEKKLIFLTLTFLTLFSMAAFAGENASGWAVDAKVGSVGIGVDISRSIVPGVLNFRTGVSYFSYSTDYDEVDITYDAKLKLGAVPIAVDVFPFKNWFRLGGGVIVNLNEISGDAKPSGTGTVDIGDKTYKLSDLGQVNGKIKFNRAAPYFGLGFNNPIKKSGHWGFFADLGAIYHGEPKLSLTATNMLTGLQAEIDKQVSQSNEDLKDFKLFPVIQFGVSYKF